VFAHWLADWPALVGYVVVAAWQLAGLRRLLAAARGGSADAAGGAAGPPRPAELRREAVLFHLGLLVVVLALVSPLGYWSGVYIWVRAVQTLVLAIIGPGLIVLGAPWLAFRQLLRRRPGAAAEADTTRVPLLIARPAVAVVAFNVVVVCWQVPALYDPARASSALALFEHASYLAAGLLLWFQLISSRPIRARASALRRVALLVGTVIVWTVLGMVLVFGSNVLYPAYANAAHHIMSVLDDQQLSGAVLWMGMLPPAVIAGVALLKEWLDNEESAELSAGLDRLLAQRRGGWPSRPVIR
jgi:cytochrome c oxidase assembly factor CtaG